MTVSDGVSSSPKGEPEPPRLLSKSATDMESHSSKGNTGTLPITFFVSYLDLIYSESFASCWWRR